MRAKDPRLYDAISSSYGMMRREDPRIAAHIHAALRHAHSVVNVGAGTGNYEPTDRPVVAVEPSSAMLAQRSPKRAPAVQGVAEALPFPDASFDVAMGVLTVHHWSDLDAGLRELQRVAGRQVLFLFEPAITNRFWALEYWPEALEVPSERHAPGPDAVARVLDVREVTVVPVPWDCVDAFGTAFWRRPERYLEPDVQEGMSWLAQLPHEVRARGARRLAADLASGRWEERHGHLRALEEVDGGYRLVVAGG